MLSIYFLPALFSLLLLTSGVLASPQRSDKRITNAERIRRGLPLLAPKGIYKRKGTRIRPRQAASSSLPPVPPLALDPATATTQKFVVSHHIVGLTYPYDSNDWNSDVSQARAAGIDAFALNIGTDPWQFQGSQLSSGPGSGIMPAYAAASGTGFKMFLSFDMSVWSCSDSDLDKMVSYVRATAGLPAQFFYRGHVLVTTFAGSSCGNSFYANLKSRLNVASSTSPAISIVFVPVFFVDPSTLFQEYPAADGLLNWNSAWSMTKGPPTRGVDDTYLSSLRFSANNAGRATFSYQSAVSPSFYTHFTSKNWIYQSDNFVFDDRWRQVISIRDQFDIVTQNTWNDFGESSYLSFSHGDQAGAQAWVGNYGSDKHAPLRDLNRFYADAFRNGGTPNIGFDKIYLQSRVHGRDVVASGDSLGPPAFGPPYLNDYDPNGRRVEEDSFFALVFASAPGSLVLSSGSTSLTFSVPQGISKYSLPLVLGQGMKAVLSRGNAAVATVAPAFTFANETVIYNWDPVFYSS